MDNIKNTNLIPPSPNIDINTLKPFTRFCCSIGAIPASYLVAMSYEEQLLWLCDYLQNTVIPTVNNNGEAVAELQGLYVELKNYVDNYLKNLDVQNEINIKLDEMASDGTLSNLLLPIVNETVKPLQNDVNVLTLKYNELNSKVNSYVSGNPIIVDSTEEMTDTSKIYVLSSNGHIYYYDDVSKTFIDSNLTYSNDLTNYLGTKSNIDGLDNTYNLNDLTETGLYYIKGSSQPVNTPFPNAGVIIVFYQNIDRFYQFAIDYKTLSIYKRNFVTNEFTPWKKSFDFNYFVNIDDLNKLTENGYSYLSTNNNIKNTPSKIGGLLINFYENLNRGYQIYYASNGSIYRRNILNNIWSNWYDASKNYYDYDNVNELLKIYIKGVEFNFKHITDDAKNYNAWRFAEVKIDDFIINPEYGDIEGPLKELGAEDFISGVHGNELFNDLTIFIDGSRLSSFSSELFKGNFNKIVIYEKSTVYRNVNTPVISRNLQIEIDEKITVNNNWKFLVDNFLVEKATSGGVFSIFNNLLNFYSTNLDYELKTPPTSTNGTVISSNNISEVTFITNQSKYISVKKLKNYPYENSILQNFTSDNRLKAYLYAIDSAEGIKYDTNDVLNTSFEINIY